MPIITIYFSGSRGKKGIIERKGAGPQTHYILSNISIGQYRTVKFRERIYAKITQKLRKKRYKQIPRDNMARFGEIWRDKMRHQNSIKK